MQNNRTAKILVFGGLALLTSFIFIRGVNLKNADEIVDIKKLREIYFEESKPPAKEKKTELLDHLKGEEKKLEFEKIDMEYVQLDLKKIAENAKNGIALEEIKQSNKSQPGKSKSRIRLADSKPIVVVSEKPNSQDDRNKNPFGTITSNYSAEQNDKEFAKDYYPAQVFGDQKLMSNTSLIVRNMEDMNYQEIHIPKNSIFYGIVSFSGNRVMVHIGKVKTSDGEFRVKYGVMDNDRIEGLYYQAPIDEVVASTADNTNLNKNATASQAYGSVINSFTSGAVNGAKQLIQKSKSLNLSEGYSLFLLPEKNDRP